MDAVAAQAHIIIVACEDKAEQLHGKMHLLLGEAGEWHANTAARFLSVVAPLSTCTKQKHDACQQIAQDSKLAKRIEGPLPGDAAAARPT